MSKMKERRFLGETEHLLEQFIDNVLALAHCAVNKPATSPYEAKVQNSEKRAVLYWDEKLLKLYKEVEKDIKAANKKISIALEEKEA